SNGVDDWDVMTDADWFHVARELARREGMLLGGSTGTNVAAALRYARRLGPGHLVVALGCDPGRNYLSKFFDDGWLTANKLTFAEPPTHSVGDLLQRRGEWKLVTIAADATAEQASQLLDATGISQLPVMDSGKPVGSVQEV